MNRKAFVLLSGGLDSTTCLYQAIYDFCPQDLNHGYGDKEIIHELLRTTYGKPSIDWVEAFGVNYGQRHIKETEYARSTCDHLGIRYSVLPVGELLAGASVMLTEQSRGNVDMPDISYSDIKGVSPTYVPFRNGLMLSAITAQAQKYVNEQIKAETELLNSHRSNPTLGLEEASEKAARDAVGIAGIYFGAHSEDAHNWAYPDCTPEFIGAMANAIHVGSYFAIRLHTPLQWLDKAGVVTLGAKLGVPFENTWSCYKGETKQCGTCPTCRSRKDAFRLAGVNDPTEYAA